MRIHRGEPVACFVEAKREEYDLFKIDLETMKWNDYSLDGENLRKQAESDLEEGEVSDSEITAFEDSDKRFSVREDSDKQFSVHEDSDKRETVREDSDRRETVREDSDRAGDP